MQQEECYTCGVTIRRPPSKFRGNHAFCSIPCRAEYSKTLPAHNKGQKRKPEWIEKQKANHARLTGENHGRWKGGRRIDKDGYVMIWMPTHPNSDYHGYMREHRLVMEKHLGRILSPSEVVHHKDLNKQNNLISNLELHNDASSHNKEHYKQGTGGAGKLRNNPYSKTTELGGIL